MDLDAGPPPPTPAQRTGSEYNDDLVHLVESIDIFREAARVERLLLATIWGRILFIGFAIASGNIAKAQAVGFLPNARRDVEVEIVRMLPAATPGEPRSPTTKRVGAKEPQKK